MNVNDFLFICLLIGVGLGLALSVDTDPDYKRPTEREFESGMRRLGLDQRK